jgi:hypothetical protein
MGTERARLAASFHNLREKKNIYRKRKIIGVRLTLFFLLY